MGEGSRCCSDHHRSERCPKQRIHVGRTVQADGRADAGIVVSDTLIMRQRSFFSLCEILEYYWRVISTADAE